MASCLSLDADAAALRQHMMRATSSPWKTKVQVSVGRLTLGGVRTGLGFVEHPDAEKARLALRAVRRASVGVYGRDTVERGVAFEQLRANTDRAMHRRGWSRIIALSDEGNVVLAYVPTNTGSGRTMEICLAVMKRRELVLVSAAVDADAIADFVQQYLPEELRDTFQRRRTAATVGQEPKALGVYHFQ